MFLYFIDNLLLVIFTKNEYLLILKEMECDGYLLKYKKNTSIKYNVEKK
ncbi:MAG: hypothetical protein JWR23_2357 [Mucilaginibacter sp.]|nr:hypothetical protein [Mucilaginibacter sp.]